jgi:tRNA pseudouridine32 synthase/23S rRNA pseudouridine746 synthase
MGITTSSYFTPFKEDIDVESVNINLRPYDAVPPLIAQIAANELQDYLRVQTDFCHNFGLNGASDNPVIGKMFGVLVVRNTEGQIGYLAAVSGKLGGKNIHKKFVPPIYDMLDPDSFLPSGMEKLKSMSLEITSAMELGDSISVSELKKKRSELSISLQQELFSHYNLMNEKGDKKNIVEIFFYYRNHLPPSAAGECAAPKLLQYAIQHNLIPVAIAEFWWGLSPKSTKWIHKKFYPACEEKCRPILNFMLGS